MNNDNYNYTYTMRISSTEEPYYCELQKNFKELVEIINEHLQQSEVDFADIEPDWPYCGADVTTIFITRLPIEVKPEVWLPNIVTKSFVDEENE